MAVPKADVVYIAADDVRGVPIDDFMQLRNWLLPARFVNAARDKAEIVRRPGRPVCRVCGAVMGKETRQVMRFKFQKTYSAPSPTHVRPIEVVRNAYLHLGMCIPPGQEAPDTVTQEERKVYRDAFGGAYDWLLGDNPLDAEVAEFLNLIRSDFHHRPPSIPSSMLSKQSS